MNVSLVLQVAYTIVACFLGLLGNTLVLHATQTTRTSFKVDKITVFLIRNLAISDWLYIVLVVLPSANCYLGNEWHLGNFTCYFVAFVGTWLASANLHFLLFVAAHRFLKCVAPWKVYKLSKQHIIVIGIAIWVYSGGKIMILAAMGCGIKYIPDVYRCGVDYVDFGHEHPPVLLFVWVIGKWIPFTLIIVLNVCLLVIARIRFGRTTNRGLTMILSISLVLTVAWIPPFLYSILGAVRHPTLTAPGRIVLFELAAYNFYMIGLFANPIVYGFRDKHFQAYIKKNCERLRASCTPTPPSVEWG